MQPVTLRVFLFLMCLAIAAPAERTAAKPTPKPTQKPALTGTDAAEPDRSALGAIALLPKDVAPKVARIEGPDGHPFPDRWYILVQDASAPRGLREFVFADGKLVTSRTISQFADSLSPEDVIGAAAIKTSNEQAAGMAAQFAMFNAQQLATIRYELFKAPGSGVPVWHLTCADRSGQALGSIDVHATKGALIAYQGFEKSPLTPQPVAAAAQPSKDNGAEASGDNASESKRPKRSASEIAQARARSERRNAPPRAVPVGRPLPPVREGPVDRVGGFFRRVFRD
jgi:hypothetical protein